MCEPDYEGLARIAYYRCQQGTNVSSHQSLSCSQTLSWYVIKDMCYQILPMLKNFQYFAYSLFYAWAVHLRNKKDMSPCLFFQNLILKFSAFDQFSKNIK